MDKSNNNEPQESGGQNRSLTLEQALLAPLDSILKAQLHSARSFLNMLLQLGYPHKEKDDGPQPDTDTGQPALPDTDGASALTNTDPDEPYHLEFAFKDEDNNKQMLRIPALSLVPISPLAVDSASFELEMAADEVVNRRQIRTSADGDDAQQKKNYHSGKRPWFLVDEPLDIRGEIIAPSSSDQASKKQTQSSIKINIQVKSIPMPAGLNKLLTSLTNMSEIQDLNDTTSNNE